MEKVHELNFLTDAEEIEEEGKKCEVSNCREFNSAVKKNGLLPHFSMGN